MGIFLTLKCDWVFNGKKADWVDIAVKELKIGPHTINYNGVSMPITVLSDDKILLHRTLVSGKLEKIIIFGDYADGIAFPDLYLEEGEPIDIKIGPEELFVETGCSELIMINEKGDEFCMLLVWSKDVPQINLPVFPQIP